MRSPNICGPGVAADENFCPNCHTLLDQLQDLKLCPLCRYEMRQSRQRRLGLRRR